MNHLDPNSTAVPEVLEYITTKFVNDSGLYEQLQNLLKMVVSHLYTKSLSHGSFCDKIETPDGITIKLLQLFGVTDRQLSAALEQMGFFKGHRMYADLYYQTLATVYYIGLRKQDDVLRLYALVLMGVKIFNGRKYKYMPNGCQENIAQHLMQNVLLKTHTFLRYPNPFNFISQYLAPSMDAKYNEQILRFPNDPKRGLLVILVQSWNRIDQIFNGLAQHYYTAWDNKQFAQSNTNLTNAQSVENLSGTRINDMVDKTMKNMLSDLTKLSQTDIRYLRSAPYNVSELFLNKTHDFISSHQYEDDVKNIVELMYNILDITDEHKMCNTNVVMTVGKLSGIKEKVSTKHDLKGYVDSLLKSMFGNVVVTAGASTLLKLRKVLMLIILLRCKKALCSSSATFEQTTI